MSKLNDQEDKKVHQVVLGMGSNISPRDNLRSSIYLLGRLVPINAVSGVWQTRSIGSPGPDFLNAAALITTQSQILLFVVGFCGGFTTFSTFAFQNATFLKNGDLMQFALYTIATFVIGILAVFAGLFIAKSF